MRERVRQMASGLVNHHSVNVSLSHLTCCITSYQLVSDKSVIQMTTCLLHAAVDCGQLDSPVNGRVLFVSTIFRATAIYSCTAGFELVGVAQRVCTADGVWSGVEPVCQRKKKYIQQLHLILRYIIDDSIDVNTFLSSFSHHPVP